MREQDEIAKDYAKTFLLIAPNVIVLERLKGDFANGNIFREDPIRPREFGIFWDFDCVMRGEGERAHSEGVLFLTNIQQLYDRPDLTNEDEPEVMTAILGRVALDKSEGGVKDKDIPAVAGGPAFALPQLRVPHPRVLCEGGQAVHRRGSIS